MFKQFRFLAILFILIGAALPAGAQQPPAAFGPALTVCGQPVDPPIAQPPANSGPVVYLIVPCFEAQGNVTLVDTETYLFYIKLPVSQPSRGVWVPWDADTEKTVIEDHKRLWGTNFLDDLRIESTDYTFANGVIGKIITYYIEERQRVKIIEYVGSKKVESNQIDERLRQANLQIKTDGFVDDSTIRKVEGIVRDMLKEKGFPYSDVTHELKPLPGGPKLVHLTFHLDEGPQVKIRHIEFVGNSAIGDGRLRSQMKSNKSKWFFSFITKRGTYHADKFEEDAERVSEYYRDKGFVRVNIGTPDVKVLEDSSDKKTRWIDLRIPVTEGARYKIGDFKFEGVNVLKSDYVRTLFNVKTGDYYNNKKIAEGYKKMKDAYGTGGYWEVSGFPDFKFSDDPDPAKPAVPAALSAEAPKVSGAPFVDVTMQVKEGTQYFVNRITFSGNTTTYDNVVRREMQLYENAVFNTEALKYSVRRINQLGYFRALDEQRDVTLEKAPGTENKVDVQVRLEEQNRNQINFGAGVSQFEGFFGQLSFQTANFLGRGETLTMSLQSGSRAKNYSLGFTEPFLFERNITGGFNVFRSDIRYVGQYTQRSSGAVTTLGLPLGRGFTRMYTNYSYERVRVTEINPIYNNPDVLRRNPFLQDALLLNTPAQGGGERVISKVTPTIVHNTVDQPLFPTTGTRLSAAVDLAGLGGNVTYQKPTLEGIWYWKQSRRFIFGVRGRAEYIHGKSSGSGAIPIFERLFLGGEYDVRGFDLRAIGPTDPQSGLVLGGNKTLLINLEQSFSIASQVRLIFFFDAGQVRDFGKSFAFRETLSQLLPVAPPLLLDPLQPPIVLYDPLVKPALFTFNASAFKSSLGAEVRFFMPVLNVPFRLIFAYDPSRAGVFDSSLRLQRAFQFRFAVGTTF